MTQGPLWKRMDSAEKKVGEWPPWMKNIRESKSEQGHTASCEQADNRINQRHSVKTAHKKAEK
ncbi:MAG: hypothetical protein C0508_01185 [Cyanobacteria bacterium PR.023]|nr:hypothetical protein [Cyanobacteria bacterium PR.3.49]MBA4073621.1 hypothetical protein [Cyanobacteria bacterium PR.023]